MQSSLEIDQQLVRDGPQLAHDLVEDAFPGRRGLELHVDIRRSLAPSDGDRARQVRAPCGGLPRVLLVGMARRFSRAAGFALSGLVVARVLTSHRVARKVGKCGRGNCMKSGS